MLGAIRERLSRPLQEVRGGYSHFANGDILFAKITPCMENGKIAIADGLLNGIGCGTTEFHVIRPTEALHPKYLWSYLRQSAFSHLQAKCLQGVSRFIGRVPE
jgi:type I restriction enzyme S subunit